MTPKPVASLSLDLDNMWSYMKTHGDPGWQTFPSYLDVVVPRVLGLLEELGLKITFFIVGQDAALEKNHVALKAIAEAGHEIGNHSFYHEPWLHQRSVSEIDSELGLAEVEIERATGIKPRGFRGPGFSFSNSILEVLQRRGYKYDASTFPTFLGPLARAYYFMTADLSDEEMQKRKELFGRFSDGFRPLKPYQIVVGDGEITEIPVTTLPLLKTPIHVSYLLYLSKFSPLVASSYFRTALRMTRLTGCGLSLLLHPLDFLGREDISELAFFPGMDLSADNKIKFVTRALKEFTKDYEVGSMIKHATAVTSEPQRYFENKASDPKLTGDKQQIR